MKVQDFRCRHVAGVCLIATLLGPALVSAEDTWTGVERIVAVGDVHADYERFRAVLAMAGVIDKNGRWAGGRTHLVQTGDVLDRGPDARKVLDLLMDLEKQAERAGGRVHALIGNHEAMNLHGDLRYLVPDDYAAFRDSGSQKVREQFYAAVTAAQPAEPGGDAGPPPDTEARRKAFEERFPLGWVERWRAFGPAGRYGRWLREKNAVVKINGILFLHGGISSKYASMTVRQLNDAVRAALNDPALTADGAAIASSIVADPDGPLWYRGLASGDEAALSAHVDGLLAAHGAERLVIGHTVTEGAIMPRFGARVVLIDVGLSKYYGGPPAALVIERGRFYALHRGMKLALPAGAGADLVTYLKKAAAADPQPSPLEKRIKELEPAEPGEQLHIPGSRFEVPAGEPGHPVHGTRNRERRAVSAPPG